MSMSKGKDCAIKLFGKTIPILEVLPCKRDLDKKLQDDGNANCSSKEAEDLNGSTSQDHNPKTPTIHNESPESETEDNQNDTRSLQLKHLKKPDRILSCPRCNSMETKFCYYNNYNLSQPRYFCRNCQRYWTAGGAMRNVPVGSGRRKNKIPSPQYGHVGVSEGLEYGVRYPNGQFLTFRPDTSLCESMASVFIADNNIQNSSQNGFYKPGMLESLLKNQPSMSFNGENGSSIMQNGRIYPPQLPFYAGPRWPYSSQWVPPPTPFYPPAPSWGYARQPPCVTPSLSSTLNSPALGKHCRDEDASRQSNNVEEQEESEENGNERSLWFSKTLKINDLGETSKSSVWATLGVKHGKRDPKGDIFEAFESNANEKSDRSDTSPLLQDNSAALSRSHDFREKS